MIYDSGRGQNSSYGSSSRGEPGSELTILSDTALEGHLQKGPCRSRSC